MYSFFLWGEMTNTWGEMTKELGRDDQNLGQVDLGRDDSHSSTEARDKQWLHLAY